jgi:acetylornithine deacetylase/succinyl-diaminopimelate desuccinylase-like protein
VREPSAAERAAFAGLPFDEPGWLAGPAGGARATAGEAGWSTVQRLWVRPTAEINGISGGYTGPGVKTIVPRDASAKLSFRLVPGQRPDDIRAKVLAHLRAAAPAGLTLDVLGEQGAVAPCHSDIDHPATVAVRAALAEAFGTAMLFSREGGSGPEAEIQEELGGVPLTFLGVGLPDDRIHAPGERVTLSLLHRGAHAAATLWRTLPAASPPHAG